jgi:tetratricopeptide (TPR) repeat protein
MNHLCSAALSLLLLAAAASGSQSSPPLDRTSHPASLLSQEQAAAAYSQEPFIIEQYFTTARFENDGTGERDLSVRIRVQNDAGAQQLGHLAFAYNSANERVDVRFVRVHKSDGTIVDAAQDAVKDAPAAEIRGNAAYSNQQEKRIDVPELHPGDILEYKVATRLVAPAAPGQFWLEHSFLDDAIVLDERFEVDVPAGRKLTIQSPHFPYSSETDPVTRRRTYRWKRANLTRPSPNSSREESEAQEAKPPEVQLTTFAGWPDVARWYAKLAHGRSEPTPEIRAKTKELIEDRANELDQVQAIYEYVARHIRYVAIPFGTASYQPHSAAEVFQNQYGDSKDQQTLLAAMLQAAGIQSNAVLIPSSRELDASLPSPAQFDHVLTAVPRGKQLIWMDPTAEVAPFRLLPAPLRNKAALVVSPDGSGSIVNTPANLPFLSTQDVEIEGQLSDLGKLTASVHYQLRGDTEFLLRLAFHRTPSSGWKQLGQTILTLDGVHGTVTSVEPSDPTDTRNPFELEIKYTQWNVLDWSSKRERVTMPLLVIGMPDAHDQQKPIHFGSPLNVLTRLKLTLPPNFTADPPAATAINRDYAAFQSSYHVEGHTLNAERLLDFKVPDLPASRADDYLAFRQAVEADQNRTLAVENSAERPEIPSTAQPVDLFEAGVAALGSGNFHAAIPLFKRLVELEPQHKEAWNDLGLAYLRLRQFDDAEVAFRKQIEVNPSDEHAHDYLGLAFQQQKKYDEASAAFREQIQINPLDTIAHAALGELFLSRQQYADAVPELEKATVLSPGNAGLEIGLGQAYVYTGETAKAVAAFEKAVETSPTPDVWNNVAYNMADHKIELDSAQQYAESAISAASADLENVDLSNVTLAEWNDVASLANYWDTLGWIYFQKGDLSAAEPYIRSAWLLSQQGEIGQHLGQIYEKHGEKDQAIRTYALALAASHPAAEARARLTLLLGGNAAMDDLVNQARPALLDLRTFPVGKTSQASGRADFLILMSPGEKPGVPHIDAVRFVGGSESLRPFAERLRSLIYGPVFPSASPAKVVRRGRVSCSPATGDCSLILLLPEDARALN